MRPNFTLNLGLRWEGAFNPTPEANNDFLLDLVKGFQFPIGRTTDPTTIPDQTNQWGPRVGFSWDPWNDGRTAVRGFAGLYFARTPMLIMAGPMNNYRVPAGDLSIFLPFRDPKGVNNTIYQQFKLIGIDLNTTPLDQPPQRHPGADHPDRRRPGPHPQPVPGLAAHVHGQRLREPAGHPVRPGSRARDPARADPGRRGHLRGHRQPAAQPQREPARAHPALHHRRSRAAALLRPAHARRGRSRSSATSPSASPPPDPSTRPSPSPPACSGSGGS